MCIRDSLAQSFDASPLSGVCSSRYRSVQVRLDGRRHDGRPMWKLGMLNLLTISLVLLSVVERVLMDPSCRVTCDAGNEMNDALAYDMKLDVASDRLLSIHGNHNHVL